MASLFEQACHHAADVILSAEQHRQHPHGAPRLVDVEPVDRASNSEMAQTGQDVVVALATMRRRRDAVRGGADFPYPRGATTLTPETPESHYCHTVSERSTLHAMSDPEVRGSTAEERAVGAFADAQAAVADSPRDRQERGTDE